MLITPAMAKELLRFRSPIHPDPDDNHVDAFAKKMRAKEWHAHSTTPILIIDGILEDGVVRLKACIQADTPFECQLIDQVDRPKTGHKTPGEDSER